MYSGDKSKSLSTLCGTVRVCGPRLGGRARRPVGARPTGSPVEERAQSGKSDSMSTTEETRHPAETLPDFNTLAGALKPPASAPPRPTPRPSVPETDWGRLADEIDLAQEGSHRPSRRRFSLPVGATERAEPPARVQQIWAAEAAGHRVLRPPVTGSVLALLKRGQGRTRCPSWAHRFFRNAGRSVLGPCRDRDCEVCGPAAAWDLLCRLYAWLGPDAAEIQFAPTREEALRLRQRFGGDAAILRRVGDGMWAPFGEAGYTVIARWPGGLHKAERDRHILDAVFLLPTARDPACACDRCAERSEHLSVIRLHPETKAEDVKAAFEAEDVKIRRHPNGTWSWDREAMTDSAWVRIASVLNPVTVAARGLPVPRGPTA